MKKNGLLINKRKEKKRKTYVGGERLNEKTERFFLIRSLSNEIKTITRKTAKQKSFCLSMAACFCVGVRVFSQIVSVKLTLTSLMETDVCTCSWLNKKARVSRTVKIELAIVVYFSPHEVVFLRMIVKQN